MTLTDLQVKILSIMQRDATSKSITQIGLAVKFKHKYVVSAIKDLCSQGFVIKSEKKTVVDINKRPILQISGVTIKRIKKKDNKVLAIRYRYKINPDKKEELIEAINQYLVEKKRIS